ncbi:MAG: ribonuclease H family protein [Nitrospira sp.]|nr:ribonuclease HI [Candidatus Manganitrophaceae bacterium]HIL35404.1 ribonuclease HI [Candidatus Manganitrophaceae bacterium]
MPKKFYVVWVGRKTGVFTSWLYTKKQVDQFPGAIYKSFTSREESEAAYTAGWKSSPTKKVRKEITKLSGLELASTKTFEVVIYCDGACDPNPGKAGSGLAVYRSGRLVELWYGLYNPHGTNNTAELNALHQALLIAKPYTAQGRAVQIFCDSKYTINCVTVWAYGWKKKGWRRKKAGDIKNLEIIQEAHALYEKIRKGAVISHVKAHSGIEGNELADRMSVFGIDRRELSFFRYSEPMDIKKLLDYRRG